MATGLIKSVLTHISKGNFSVLIRGVIERSQSRIPETIEFVADASTPDWMISDNKYNIFRYGKKYVPISENSNITVAPDKFDSNIRSIEVPIVSIERSHSASVSYSDTKSTNSNTAVEFKTDSSYDYPLVVWNTLAHISKDSEKNIRLDVNEKNSGFFRKLFLRFTQPSRKPMSTTIGLPSVLTETQQPPIILISIDALGYRYRKKMDELVTELGENAILPSEPRTQGTWTPPSHGSMFTGTHPGKHGFVEFAKHLSNDRKRPINPELVTIPEILTNQGYKCSALVSHNQILPEFGFGRGFHRFLHDGMTYSDWITREHDAEESVNQLISWIEEDITVRDHSLFYFLHVFDPHYPYIPPTELLGSPTVDFSKAEEYMSQVENIRGDGWDYLDGYSNDDTADPHLTEKMQNWHSKSIEYVANQLSRLLRHLKHRELFDDSLIIITGDHGEEFGERGFFTHNSLYDNNIRPFMAVKPPDGETWPNKERIDTVDFLPTIAKLVGAEIPEQIDGIPIQVSNRSDARITERFYPNWYNISVEIGQLKGILTYQSNYPDRPNECAVNSQPQLEEYYQIPQIRDTEVKKVDPPENKKSEIKSAAKEFILDSNEYGPSQLGSAPSRNVIDRLEKLGYK